MTIEDLEYGVPSARSHGDSGDRRYDPADRLPPQDLDAERSVLGGMMISKDAIADVVEVLRG
ncbi:MAG: replicative DNA helicase, partial [Cellulomonas sp.]|nr:replicative DNA helicase [Cellulomonas sp.]